LPEKTLSEVEKMKTKRIPKLRRGASDAEAVRWAKAHDVFNRLDSGVAEVVEDHSDLDRILEEAVLQDNTAQLNMRIPPAMKAVLSRLARERTTDATTLARIWLAERLQQELKAG
jgi:predicted transcriptional regulator